MGDTLTMEVIGMEALEKRFKDLDKEGRKKVKRAINANALDFQMAVRKSISKNTGRHIKYKRGRKAHWSSSPRRAPNSDTGNLKENVRVTRRATNASLGAIVISGAKYSSALEFGHKVVPRRGALVTVRRAPTVEGPRRGFVAPRPFMLPMLKRNTKQYLANIKQAMNGAVVTRGSSVTNRKMNNRITSGKTIR